MNQNNVNSDCESTSALNCSENGLSQVLQLFMAKVTSDLRTPLSSIIANIELLLNSNSEEEIGAQKDLLNHVMEAALQLEITIDALPAINTNSAV